MSEQAATSSGRTRTAGRQRRASTARDVPAIAPRTIDEILASSRARLDRLTPQAAWDAAADGAILIDTRCAELRERDGTVPGALHIPLSVLHWRADPTSGHHDPRIADRKLRLVLLCEHGYSSSLAAATLLEMGFARATDVEGGFEAWAAAGLPTVRGGRAP